MAFALVSLSIERRFQRGLHVFSSRDLPELHLSRRSARAAYENVRAAVAMAVLLRTGRWPAVDPAETMDEFLAQAERDRPDRAPAGPTTHRYNVRFAAGG